MYKHRHTQHRKDRCEKALLTHAHPTHPTGVEGRPLHKRPDNHKGRQWRAQ